MKRVLSMILLLLPMGVFAQSKMFFKAGGNVSSLSNALNSELDEPISKVGFHAGLGADISLTKSNNVTIQTGLLFTQRGYLADFKSETARSTTTLNYIDLPVNVMLKTGNEENSTKFFVFGGGYIACGVGGKTKKRVSGEVTNETSVRYDYDLNRFDYGVQGGVGVQFDYFQVNAFYQKGLSNISAQSLNAKNQNFGITLTYLFDNLF